MGGWVGGWVGEKRARTQGRRRRERVNACLIMHTHRPPVRRRRRRREGQKSRCGHAPIKSIGDREIER